jgi:hypothetical protein
MAKRPSTKVREETEPTTGTWHYPDLGLRITAASKEDADLRAEKVRKSRT